MIFCNSIACKNNTLFILKALVFILLAVLALCNLFFFHNKTAKPGRYATASTLGIYEKAAVTSNGIECAQIGADILKKNGSAVDAAIAILICEGVSAFPSMGLGGGFTMVIYDAKTNKKEFLIARETAPSFADKDMYQNNSSLSFAGGLAIAIPGELRGYWEAHQKYGRLKWSELFQPSIELCKTGTILTEYVYNQLKLVEPYIRKEKGLQEFLIDPKTDQYYPVGSKIIIPRLGETLTRLAESQNASQLFYEGDLADTLIKEITTFGGKITKEDLINYRVKWTTPLEVAFGNYTLFTSAPPGSGCMLVFILKVLKGLIDTTDEKIFWQRMIETFKYAYAKRSELGDPDYLDTDTFDKVMKTFLTDEYADKVRQKILNDKKTYNDPKYYEAEYKPAEDHGTGQVSVLAPDGSAVAVTSTINQLFGSKKISPSTGIIFNDQMDDFSSPGFQNGYGYQPGPNNYIAPGKRPVSSTNPTIVFDKNGKVRLVIGCAGGSRINTATATVMIFNLFKGYNIKEAIDLRRLHHQLFPMEVSYEEGFAQDVLDYMKSIGHRLNSEIIMESSVTAVSVENGKIYANGDGRREAVEAGF